MTLLLLYRNNCIVCFH